MYFEDVSDLWRESPREVVLPRVKMMRALIKVEAVWIVKKGSKVVKLIETGYHLTWIVRKKENVLIISTTCLVVCEATVRETQQEFCKELLSLLSSLFTSPGKQKKKIYFFIMKRI